MFFFVGGRSFYFILRFSLQGFDGDGKKRIAGPTGIRICRVDFFYNLLVTALFDVLVKGS